VARRLSDTLRAIPARAQSLVERDAALVAALAHQSVKFGTETVGGQLTGAPGQPVDTGNLRNSWLLTQEGPVRWRVSTNVEYAPFVEDGIGRWGAVRYGQKNGIGGSHSVKKTILGFPRILEYVSSLRANGLAGGLSG
jgi:hypothetical protein